MSTYWQAWGGTLSTCPDPQTWTPENQPVVGRIADGQPIQQGREAGAYSWAYLTTAEYENLWDTWNSNGTTSGTFTVPDRSDSAPEDWRSVVAYGEEPSSTFGQRGRVTVSMRIVIVG
jgi:hypothetical protein